MSLEGSLGEGALPAVLRELYVGRRTGMLHFVRGADRGSACFIEGQIVWGDSTMEECHLGPTLVRHGFLTEEKFRRVTNLVGGGKRLGDVLIELEVLDRKTLDQALALQVREVLLAAFAWAEGTWSFDEHPAEYFKGYDQTLPISTGDLILDAVWCVSDLDVIRYGLGDLDRVLVVATDPLLRYQRITLSPADAFILSRVDGVLTAHAILELAPVGPEEALRGLFGLLCAGMVAYRSELATAPEPEPIKRPERQEVLALAARLMTATHFELLSVPRTATTAEVRAASVQMARRFQPDVHPDPALADLREPMTAIFARAIEAGHVLEDPQRRARYQASLDAARATAAPGERPAADAGVDASLAPEQRETLLAEAERQFGAGNVWDALQVVDTLLPELKGHQRHQARLLRARACLKNPKWAREGEQELVGLIGEDPGNVEAYFLLGQIYQTGGAPARAAAMFRRVLELKPRHAGALAALGPAPERPGLLRKLLR